ncbi:uncharacterized protein LOC108703132 isoform X2 [Xenopus laevis]|nr:uncharacterized protein LOC108703132 isoform X2 [Xenopus laevis]
MCSWEVANSSSNCSADFQLKYETQSVQQNVCIPQNRQHGGAVVPNQCVCTMSGFYIVALTNFIINLESNGTSVQRGVFPALDTAIPKVPRSITVTSGNEDDINVTWDNGYSGSKDIFLSTYLMYNIQITCKQDPTLFESMNVTIRSCSINKRYFKSGCDYEVKVRSKFTFGENGVQSFPWSDWSSAIEWHNDYSPSFDYIPSIVIPVCCFLLFLLILLCYCIINICKKKWWQNIPDPAKSSLHLIRRHMSQETAVKSDENANIYPPSNKQENAKRICTNWFNKLFFKNHHKKHLSQDCTSKRYEHICRTEGTEYSVLVPEVSVVDTATVESHLPESRKNSVYETKDIIEDKDEKQPFFDPSIDQMFQDIIDDSPFKAHGLSTTRDTLKNSNNNILPVFAFFEDHPAPLEVIQESPDRSYPCDNSETDLPTKSDHCLFSGMDHCSADQQDSLCFVPQESLYQASETKLDNGYANNGCQANTYCDSGYSSFANAVSGSEMYSVSSEYSTDKDNELSNTSSCLSRSAFGSSNSSLHSDTTDRSVYYNRQSRFFLPDTSCDTSSMNVELTLTRISEDYNTSPKEERELSSSMNICAVSNYQTFADAIQQDGTSVNHPSETLDSSVLESAYKSFESLLNQNTPEAESDTESCLCALDMGVQKEEMTQITAQNTGTNEFDNMKNTGGQTKIDFAEAPAHEITFGFLNLLSTENCLDSGCKESTEDKQPFPPKDSSDQTQDNPIKAEDIKNDFSLIYKGDTNCHLPFAWTHGLSEQWKDLTNMYGPDFPQSSPVDKIDRIIRGSHSNHTDHGKSTVTETDIGIFPHQPAFSDHNNASDSQTMKFANMSYFVPLYNELKTKRNDTQDDLATLSDHTPEHPKNHENDGCSYMQISLPVGLDLYCREGSRVML